MARRAPPRGGVGKGGQAIVRITISGSGQLLGGVSLAQSSGNGALDQAALQAVRRAGRFPKAPPAKLGISQHSFALPVTAR